MDTDKRIFTIDTRVKDRHDVSSLNEADQKAYREMLDDLVYFEACATVRPNGGNIKRTEMCARALDVWIEMKLKQI